MVSSYNWSQSPTDNLATAGSNTIHLTPCPAGVDTSNNSSAQYAVYIAGTGTAEAAAVTGGTCSSGASTGTIIVTTANVHSAGYTVGAANGGNQEAINVATATGGTHAVIQEVPTGGANTANYNIYWPVFLKAGKSLLNGYGADWACYTRSTCLMVGTYAGGANESTVEGLEFQSAVNVTGAHITSVSAAAGTYTVTTSTAHNLVAGDWAILYYTTPTQQQEARVQVLSTGLTATQFKYVVGAATFSTSAGFGWVAIENAAIEAETDGARLQDIKFNAGVNGGLFHQGVVVGNDQSFKIDGMTNEGTGGAFRCDQYFCSNMVYLRGDQGAAPVAYLHHLEASMQCSGNGVRDVAGNTLNVQDSVIQGVNQYAIYYTGGLQPWTVNNVYNESGSCTNPFYPGSLAAIAGYIDNNQPLTVVGNAPIGGLFPQFVSGGANQRNYYVISKDANLGTAPMMFIGTALPATREHQHSAVLAESGSGGRGDANLRHSGDDGDRADVSALYGECVLDRDWGERELQQQRHLQLHGHAERGDGVYGGECELGTNAAVLAGSDHSGERSEPVQRPVWTGERNHFDIVSAESVLQARRAGGTGLFVFAVLGRFPGGRFGRERQQECRSARSADWSGIGVVDAGNQRSAEF